MPRGYYGSRNWTEDEVESMVEGLQRGWPDAAIGQRIGRSAAAVNIKRKKLRIACRSKLTLSAREVARRMGIPCSKTVAWWIRRGYLAGRHGHRRGGNRRWVVRIEALYDFVADTRYRHLWSEAAITDPALRAHARDGALERFYTTGDVARMYFLANSNSVQAWIKRGHLTGAIRRGNWLIPASALDGFVPPGQRSKTGRPQRRFTPAEDARLCALAGQGLTLRVIADELGRNIGSVAGRLKRLNVRRERMAA